MFYFAANCTILMYEHLLYSSNLKEEYMSMMNNMSKNNLSPSSSNANDSDASRYC